MLYVVAMVAVIVGVDLAFFRNRFWERLAANIGIVLLFVAFYWTSEFHELRSPHIPGSGGVQLGAQVHWPRDCSGLQASAASGGKGSTGAPSGSMHSTWPVTGLISAFRHFGCGAAPPPANATSAKAMAIVIRCMIDQPLPLV